MIASYSNCVPVQMVKPFIPETVAYFLSAITSGVTPAHSVGEQLAGAAHAGLDLIEQQQQAVFVTDRAQCAQVVERTGADAALALDRLDRDAGRLVGDGGAQLVHVAEGDLIEAVLHAGRSP